MMVGKRGEMSDGEAQEHEANIRKGLSGTDLGLLGQGRLGL
jgi:hypothetical protein